MPKHKKVFVSIYCKIYTDNFSEEMVNRQATGDEIYEFLMGDSGQCYDSNGESIPDDCNIWYLGCNEKFGHLQLEDKVWNWSFGESSFDNLEAFVSNLYRKKLIKGLQFHTLMGKIDDGRRIDNMYHIRDYLICKRAGIPWIKKHSSSDFRKIVNQMVKDVETSFRKEGFCFYLT